MKEANKTHTIEQIDELKKWFEAHHDQLPATMQIEPGVYTPHLNNTINMLLEQAYICHENHKMQGCILLLKKIQQNILNTNNQ